MNMNKLYNYFIIIFILLASKLTAQTFTNVVNAQAPALGISTYTVNVNGVNIVSNLSYGFMEVNLNIFHADASEIEIKLTSPNGTTCTLIGADISSPISNTTFKMYADKSIYQFNGDTIKGVVMPGDNQIYSYLDGQDPNGNWSFQVVDITNGSQALYINSLSIKFGNAPRDSATYGFMSNLPLLKINTPSNSIPYTTKENGSITLINNGNNSFAQAGIVLPIGVERQGYTSANGPKFNMDIEFRTTDYSNDSTISILGFTPESDFVLKGAVTDGWLIKDAYTFEMSRRMGYYAPYTQFVEVMVNGEYLGLYIMEETIKRGNNRVDISKPELTDVTGGYIFEINPNGKPAAWNSPFQGYTGTSLGYNPEFKVVYPKQSTLPFQMLLALNDYVDSFEYAMYDTTTFQHPTNGWRKWASEKSIIDFMIVSEYSINYDTYGRSTFFNKDKAANGGKIKFGPPWDADRGYDYGTDDWVHLVTHGFWAYPFWFSYLRASDSLFNKRFACRYHSARKYAITNSAATNLIDSLYTATQSAGYRNQKAFNIGYSDVQSFKNTVLDRLAWMDANLDSLPYAPPPLTQTTFVQGSTINIFSNPNYTYNFIPGPDTSIFTPTSTGTYIAEVSTQYGCQTRQAFTVTNTPFTINTIVLNGNKAGNYNYLDWQYTGQVNGEYHILYSRDGSSFNTVGKLNSQLNASNFTHQAIGKAWYIIKLVSANGETINSNTIVLEDNNYADEIIYPNPVQDILYITDNRVGLYKILTTAGKVVQQGQVQANSINVYSLSPQQYILWLYTDNGVGYSKPFSKQ
jgi:subtilisin-like proprotein convertase family protein